jgi:uncharacterized protein (TIGR03435 family)
MKPEFEAAEVKLNKSGDLRMNASFLPGGEFFSRNAPVFQLIKLAWDVRDEATSGAPHWATSDRFDVAAKTAAGTPPATLRLMLQTLLEREFRLQAHTGLGDDRGKSGP